MPVGESLFLLRSTLSWAPCPLSCPLREPAANNTLEKCLASYLGEQRDKDGTRWFLNSLKRTCPGSGGCSHLAGQLHGPRSCLCPLGPHILSLVG